MRIVIAIAAASLGLAASAQAQQIEKYRVYCIGEETSVEMWDLEQMKVRRGRDVCLLYEDTTSSGARDWMDRNFPTHKCYCRNAS
ncbi:MAG: hypothetical protein K1X35_11465 [Caulobacteraceae bacterium]|nr:hypothetical protein [Caulobacteraceae bacterium]